MPVTRTISTGECVATIAFDGGLHRGAPRRRRAAARVMPKKKRRKLFGVAPVEASEAAEHCKTGARDKGLAAGLRTGMFLPQASGTKDSEGHAAALAVASAYQPYLPPAAVAAASPSVDVDEAIRMGSVKIINT